MSGSALTAALVSLAIASAATRAVAQTRLLDASAPVAITSTTPARSVGIGSTPIALRAS